MAESRNVKLQVLFPMGGLGSRFSKIGIETPKPLIPLEKDGGLPMVMKAIQSFSRLSPENLQLLFVVRKEHNEKHQLQEKILAVNATAKFEVLDHDTRGAVETCLVAESIVDPELPLVVMDCDLFFHSSAYEETILSMQEKGLSGLLLYFQSKANRYSYAQIDSETQLVTKTAEKVPISPNALIGAYGFGSGAIFLKAGRTLMEKTISGEMKEYYLSLLYNILLESNLKVKAVPMDEYHSFGTPDEMALYNKGERSYVLE